MRRELYADLLVRIELRSELYAKGVLCGSTVLAVFSLPMASYDCGSPRASMMSFIYQMLCKQRTVGTDCWLGHMWSCDCMCVLCCGYGMWSVWWTFGPIRNGGTTFLCGSWTEPETGSTPFSMTWKIDWSIWTCVRKKTKLHRRLTGDKTWYMHIHSYWVQLR